MYISTMALNIKNSETDRLAHELARETGESITEAVTVAIRDRLEALRQREKRASLGSEIAQIQAFVASLPDRDSRSEDEILGYDELGLPS